MKYITIIFNVKDEVRKDAIYKTNTGKKRIRWYSGWFKF
jgi:hypothetical protein